MKRKPKRALTEEALTFRRGVAGRLLAIEKVLGGPGAIAAAAGVSSSRYSNWKNDSEPQLPDVEAMIQLCENPKIGVTLDFIYRGKIDTMLQAEAMKIREAQNLLVLERRLSTPQKKPGPVAAQHRTRANQDR